jgi:hypothetical protein
MTLSTIRSSMGAFTLAGALCLALHPGAQAQSGPFSPGGVPDRLREAACAMRGSERMEQLVYRDDAQFDCDLARSMNAGAESIVVLTPFDWDLSVLNNAASFADTGGRAVRWQNEVINRRGASIICSLPPQQRDDRSLSWLLALAPIFANIVRNWAHYRNARNYHVITVVDDRPSGQWGGGRRSLDDALAGDTQIAYIHFVRKQELGSDLAQSLERGSRSLEDVCDQYWNRFQPRRR